MGTRFAMMNCSHSESDGAGFVFSSLNHSVSRVDEEIKSLGLVSHSAMGSRAKYRYNTVERLLPINTSICMNATRKLFLVCMQLGSRLWRFD